MQLLALIMQQESQDKQLEMQRMQYEQQMAMQQRQIEAEEDSNRIAQFQAEMQAIEGMKIEDPKQLESMRRQVLEKYGYTYSSASPTDEGGEGAGGFWGALFGSGDKKDGAKSAEEIKNRIEMLSRDPSEDTPEQAEERKSMWVEAAKKLGAGAAKGTSAMFGLEPLRLMAKQFGYDPFADSQDPAAGLEQGMLAGMSSGGPEEGAFAGMSSNAGSSGAPMSPLAAGRPTDLEGMQEMDRVDAAKQRAINDAASAAWRPELYGEGDYGRAERGLGVYGPDVPMPHADDEMLALLMSQMRQRDPRQSRSTAGY